MNISEQDYELLSAYLDGMLEDSERAELEARLESDSELRSALSSLRQTVQLVKSLPELIAPRSYTLTPEQALRLRNERGGRSQTGESKILSFVLPVLSAVASMALVLFGLSLLLSNANPGVSVENIAGVPTSTFDTGSVLRTGATPTVVMTFTAPESLRLKSQKMWLRKRRSSCLMPPQKHFLSKRMRSGR
jgi:anti-sigma factor RsiW